MPSSVVFSTTKQVVKDPTITSRNVELWNGRKGAWCQLDTNSLVSLEAAWLHENECLLTLAQGCVYAMPNVSNGFVGVERRLLEHWQMQVESGLDGISCPLNENTKLRLLQHTHLHFWCLSLAGVLSVGRVLKPFCLSTWFHVCLYLRFGLDLWGNTMSCVWGLWVLRRWAFRRMGCIFRLT